MEATVSATEDRFVQVGVYLLPLEVVRLALDLESRGLDLQLDGDNLAVGPKSLITDEDRQLIRRYKFHLMHLVAAAASVQ